MLLSLVRERKTERGGRVCQPLPVLCPDCSKHTRSARQTGDNKREVHSDTVCVGLWVVSLIKNRPMIQTLHGELTVTCWKEGLNC